MEMSDVDDIETCKSIDINAILEIMSPQKLE